MIRQFEERFHCFSVDFPQHVFYKGNQKVSTKHKINMFTPLTLLKYINTLLFHKYGLRDCSEQLLNRTDLKIT